MDDDEMLLASVTMFAELGLISKFNIDRKVSSYKTLKPFHAELYR